MATKDDLNAAIDAGDLVKARAIAAQLRNEVADVLPVPSDDYLGQRATAEAETINAGRQAVGGNPLLNTLRNNVPGLAGLPGTMDDARRNPEQRRADTLEDIAASGDTPRMKALSREIVDSPFSDKAMQTAGMRTSGWADSLANLGNTSLGALTELNKSLPGADLFPARQQLLETLEEKALGNEEEYTAKVKAEQPYRDLLDKNSGGGGLLGDLLAYYASGVAVGPIVSKGLGLATDLVSEVGPFIARGVVKPAGNIIERAANASKFTGERLTGPGIQSREFLPNPAAEWANREVVQPVKKGVEHFKNRKSLNPLPLSPMTAGAGKNIAAGTTLGAVENSLDPDPQRDAISGALSGFFGGVGGAVAKPWLTRTVNPKFPEAYSSNAEKELMDTFYKRGMSFDPGMTTGDPNLQVAVRNLQNGPAKGMLKNFYTNQDKVLEKVYGEDVLNMPRPEGGFTSQSFADHSKSIDEGYDAIRKNTTGVFDEPRMTQVDKYLEGLYSDLSPKGQAIAEQAKGIRDAMYGYSAAGERAQSVPYTKDMHSAIGTKFGEIHRNLVKLAPDDAEIALAHGRLEAAKDAEKNLTRELDAKEISQNARRQAYTRDGDQAKLDELAAEVADGQVWLQQVKDSTATAAAETARLAQLSVDALPNDAAKDVATQLNTLHRLLGFNRGTRQASGMLTPDSLQNIDKALSRLNSMSQRQGPKGVERNAAISELYKQVQGALKPLKGNLGTRNDEGHIVLDGDRLESLRKDLTSQVRDLMSEPSARSQAFQLQKMLPMLDDATTYHNDFTKEAAGETRRQKAMWEWTNDNQIFRPDKSLDLHALHKAQRGDSSMAKQALTGEFSIPQKESIDLLARFQDLRNTQARSKQGNMGSNEVDLSLGVPFPGDYTPKIGARTRAQMLLNNRYPITTGLLNLKHDGPYSVYPISHGLEQSADTRGRIYRGGKKLTNKVSSLYEELMK